MKITFFGASQTVTGSKYLVETGGYNLLLDCGLHQGKRSQSDSLNRNLAFDAKKVNAVILSHAHSDHCGMLPVLVKNGFGGKIYCTAATADIAKLILEDSAVIQEQDARYFNEHLLAGETPISPIYGDEDVKKTFSHFEPTSYFRLSRKWTKLNKNIRFKFYDAGHILGSAVTLLEINERGEFKNLVFTGDLGRDFLPILRDPETVEENAKTLIIEATYGNRIHRPIADLKEDLKNVVNYAASRKSKIIVPSFSLGRTQELIYILHKLLDEKEIPNMPIFVDSPLAQKIIKVFGNYTSDFDDDFWNDFGKKGDKAFVFKDLITTSSVKESQSINEKSGPFVVIAGSGMCEGGRILHHLKNNIENPDNIVLITGYQAENTLGRKIIDGVSPVKIFGSYYNVRAQIKVLGELSAHADQKNLLDYAKSINGLEKIFLVHSELDQSLPLKEALLKLNPSLSVEIPQMGQLFEM